MLITNDLKVLVASDSVSYWWSCGENGGGDSDDDGDYLITPVTGVMTAYGDGDGDEDYGWWWWINTMLCGIIIPAVGPLIIASSLFSLKCIFKDLGGDDAITASWWWGLYHWSNTSSDGDEDRSCGSMPTTSYPPKIKKLIISDVMMVIDDHSSDGVASSLLPYQTTLVYNILITKFITITTIILYT